MVADLAGLRRCNALSDAHPALPEDIYKSAKELQEQERKHCGLDYALKMWSDVAKKDGETISGQNERVERWLRYAFGHPELKDSEIFQMCVSEIPKDLK